MESDQERRGEVIREAMGDLTTASLGIKLRIKDNDFTVSRLAQIVSGEVVANDDELLLIAKTLGVDADSLMQHYRGQYPPSGQEFFDPSKSGEVYLGRGEDNLLDTLRDTGDVDLDQLRDNIL